MSESSALPSREFKSVYKFIFLQGGKFFKEFKIILPLAGVRSLGWGWSWIFNRFEELLQKFGELVVDENGDVDITVDEEKLNQARKSQDPNERHDAEMFYRFMTMLQSRLPLQLCFSPHVGRVAMRIVDKVTMPKFEVVSKYEGRGFFWDQYKEEMGRARGREEE